MPGDDGIRPALDQPRQRSEISSPVQLRPGHPCFLGADRIHQRDDLRHVPVERLARPPFRRMVPVEGARSATEPIDPAAHDGIFDVHSEVILQELLTVPPFELEVVQPQPLVHEPGEAGETAASQLALAGPHILADRRDQIAAANVLLQCQHQVPWLERSMLSQHRHKREQTMEKIRPGSERLERLEIIRKRIDEQYRSVRLLGVAFRP